MAERIIEHIGWCECGDEIGQTLVGTVWHWTHGDYLGAPADREDGDQG